MNLDIENNLLVAYGKAGGKNQKLLEGIRPKTDAYWHQNLTFHSDIFTEADLILLIELVEKTHEFRDQVSKRQELRRYKAVLKLKHGDVAKIISLEVMATALRKHLMPLKKHWLFKQHNGYLVPWFVENIEYHPAESGRDHYVPAYVNIQLKAKRRGKEEDSSISFRRESLGFGSSPSKLLEILELLPESDDLLKAYEEEMAVYDKFSQMSGEQFIIRGKGELGLDDEKDDDDWSSRWNRDLLNFEKEGHPSRAIMDDNVQFGDKEGSEEQVYADVCFWDRKGEKDEDEEHDENMPILAPVQPFVCVFSLMSHEFAVTHISNLTLYEYDETLVDKLVLPGDHRQLIDILIGTSTKNSEDLVKGKKGGVVILCSGAPGTGKTLTAEVYSEVAKRPLYMVQCSQLGIDAEDLEKELGRVLRRSVRWNAILLIDEADVYIHERGTDVNQNAIVGVFLRLLEYYSGVLFLTTNRETVTDDAIRSRCMAHIHYGVVKQRLDKIKLWKILSTQYKLNITDAMIEELIELFPQLSGRTVKQFCRLAQAMSDTKPLTVDLFIWLAQFQTQECKIDEKVLAKRLCGGSR